jgi:hypothetical protein
MEWNITRKWLESPVVDTGDEPVIGAVVTEPLKSHMTDLMEFR